MIFLENYTSKQGGSVLYLLLFNSMFDLLIISTCILNITKNVSFFLPLDMPVKASRRCKFCPMQFFIKMMQQRMFRLGQPLLFTDNMALYLA